MSPQDAELNMLLLPIIQLMVIYKNCNSLYSSKESVITEMCLAYFFRLGVDGLKCTIFLPIHFMILHFSCNQFTNISRGILRAAKMSRLLHPVTDMQLLTAQYIFTTLRTLAIKVKTKQRLADPLLTITLRISGYYASIDYFSLPSDTRSPKQG